MWCPSQNHSNNEKSHWGAELVFLVRSCWWPSPFSHRSSSMWMVDGVCNVLLCVCVCVPRFRKNTESRLYPLTCLPPWFPLAQCEGETEHWLVPPDWCGGRHPFPHQLALEVHPGWSCLTPIPPAIVAIRLDLTKAIHPYEQRFLNCRSGQNPALFSLFPHLAGFNLIYSVWVLGCLEDTHV